MVKAIGIECEMLSSLFPKLKIPKSNFVAKVGLLPKHYVRIII